MLLLGQKYSDRYVERPNRHDWYYWKTHFPEAQALYCQVFGLVYKRICQGEK